jgi:hypothetical protein
MAKASGKRHGGGNAATPSLGDCPECYRPIPADEKLWAGFVVCPHCAAFAIGDDGGLRLLKTEEWYPLMVKPEWNALMEYRHTVCERLTAPSPPS